MINDTAESPDANSKIKAKKTYIGKDGLTRQTMSTYEN